MTETWTPISDDDAAAHIGEGLHTGLRKGSEAEDAHDLWVAIKRSDTSAWSDALNYLVWGLHEMGLAVCRKESGRKDSDEHPA